MEPRHSATVVTLPVGRYHFDTRYNRKLELEESLMVWTTPTLVEICIGLEINGYLPAEF
jgi:coenzyme PQQ precursor peptide PqqA